MTAKIPTTEKILAETLELHEKGVSLHSIVRTYPEHSVEIEELFAAMATLSLEKEKIVVPKGGLERLLASLPTTEPVAPRAAQIKSPFSTFMSSIQLSTLKFVLPIAALALLTGGIVLHKGATGIQPLAVTTPETVTTPGATAPTTAPAATTGANPASSATTAPNAAAPMNRAMAMPTNPTDRMVASFSEETAKEATIAQENDAESAQASSAQQAMQTDPIK